MALKIGMLRCFVTVAQSGNLLEAATRLARTQSAVSMTLKQLEVNIGGRLFESDRKNRLTPLGEQVFELAQVQLRQFDYTVKAMETLARSPEGLVRIASIPSVAGLALPPAIEDLTSRYPALRIEMRDTDTAQVVDALSRGQADIGIASGDHRLNGIRQAPLFSDQFGLLCAPDHPLAGQDRAPTIDEVVSAGFLYNNLCSMIATPAFQTAVQGVTVSLQNTTSLVAMVRTGRWVTVLPESVVRFMSSDLVFREIAGLSDRRQVSLLMREKAPFPQFTKELWEMLIRFDWPGAARAGDAGPGEAGAAALSQP